MRDYKLKKYKAYVVNNNVLDVMIIEGINKKEVINKIKYHYFNNKKIRNVNNFHVFVVKVAYINSEYVDME